MNSSISYTEHLHDLDQIKEEIDNDSPFNFSLPPTNKISKSPNAFLSEPGTLIQVKVDTYIQQLEQNDKTCRDIYLFIFRSKRRKFKFCSVIPQTYSEMMTYIGGRRRAQDTAQYVETLPTSK